jgi:predicted aspartyl protease
VNKFPRIIAAAGVVVLVVLYPTVLSQPVSGKADHDQLAKVLKKRGYVDVPLTISKTGLLDVKVEVDGVPMLLVLDTGANNVNLDRASAKRAKLAVKESDEKTAAQGGTVPAGVTKISSLSVGEIVSPAESYVVDFSPTNAWRKGRGDPPCDGVLGGGYLKNWSAVIDCARLKLYLLDPAQRAKKLTKAMKRGGYVDVPIVLNENGLLDVKAEVDGQPMLLFLDTGDPTTISLDQSSAKRAKLAVKESKNKISALGGSLAIGQTKIGRLSVGGLTSATDAQVIDYSPSNATRKAFGAPACDGALGGRFLNRYAAVIDYAQPRLYLLDSAAK